MSSNSPSNVGETQARRLEAALAQIEALFARPEVQQRLRQAPGENEWSAMEILGHCTELVPYWVNQSRKLIDAAGELPAFGRGLDSPERIEAVERGKTGNPDALLAELRRAVAAAVPTIRALTPAELEKAGMHSRRGRMTVREIVDFFILDHAEEHVKQVQAALSQ